MMNNKKKVSIQIDADKCVACWKCMDRCRYDVLTKVEFPFHKHVAVEHPENCIGCLHCMNACKYQAIDVTRFR
ncbi:4Fe-4S binding protein [uncultured Bacteroides sp.]|uniref:DUF362 domain-containing protein n=1 Tax=uncultured Bacteroides sp. TaxID=162156 RepID=UPI002AA69045|nr:4Fe-4S binding protein [uncultured Bacteroides sp.]